MAVLGKGKMHGNGLVAGAHLQRHAMVVEQQAELLQVVAGVQVGPGQGGLEAARAGHKTITQARRLAGSLARHGVGLHPHKGVAAAHVAGQVVTRHVALHGLAQVGNAVVINQPGLRQGRSRVGKAHGRNESG